jgi:hypothetical protein
MSGDHFMSAAVLRRIAGQNITITGPKGRRTLRIDNDALKTKHLCKRHNSALSPLDAEAGRLFQALRDADVALRDEAEPRQSFFLFSGIDIERWLLKTLMMVYYARITSVQKISHRLPRELPYWLVDGVPPPYGLYFPVRTDMGSQHRLRSEHSATFALVTQNEMVVGVDVELGGFSFMLIASGLTETLNATHHYRPQHINFFRGERVISVTLVWPGNPSATVWLSHGDQFAPVPTDPPPEGADDA